MTDLELLRDYGTRRSEEAFETLVNRYINLVYSAAHRQIRDAHLAEEITQSVFLVLARKARSLKDNVVLSGWLLRTARYTAANAIRHQRSREQREQKAMETSAYQSESDQAWTEIGPQLDDAMARLSKAERDAIALRFFEQKSFREVAAALQISDANAQKRVSRAMEKLRRILLRRGPVAAEATIATAIAVYSVQSAPGGLAQRVLASVSKRLAAGTLLTALVEHTMQAFRFARLKTVAVGAAVIALVAVTALVLVSSSADRKSAVQRENSAVRAPRQAGSLSGVPNPTRLAASTPAAWMRFAVIDAETQAPVGNARLTLTQVVDSPRRSTNFFETDSAGAALLPLPDAEVKHWNYRIEVFRDGYVPKYVSWSESLGDAFGEIPADYTTKAERAIRIGGIVVNEANQPIAGMKVVFSVSGQAPGSALTRERLTMMGNYHTELTDEKGAWTCTHVPQKFGMISYRLVHREYQDATFYCDSPQAASSRGVIRLPENDFLAGTARMQVTHGLIVAGTIVGPDGKPVSHAKITEDHDWYKDESSLWTDANGHFRFQNVRPKELTLTAQADGLAPIDKVIKPEESPQDLRFELSKGARLMVRIVDEDGHAVTNAHVALDADSYNRDRSEWRTRTDIDGRSIWDFAPSGNESYVVSADGYERLSKVQIVADGSEKTLTIHKQTESTASRSVVGTVRDAETKEPIKGLKIILEGTTRTDVPGGGYYASTTRDELAGGPEPGKFRLRLSSRLTRAVVEISADGYFPISVTNDLVPGAPLPKFDLLLKPGRTLAGLVVSAEGKPVAGAVAVLCTDRDRAVMESPAEFHLNRYPMAARTESDPQGRFTLPMRSGARSIVIADKNGFAEISIDQLAASSKIVLPPWGGIAGVFKIGQRTGANERIWLGNMHDPSGQLPSVQLFLETKTDAEGRFEFHGVPPGEHQIAHVPGFRDGKMGQIPISHGIPVIVKAGETTSITLGGTGRALVGQALFRGTNVVDWREDVHTLTTKASNEPIRPSRENFASLDDFLKAMKAFDEVNHRFWNSADGLATTRSSRTYVLIFEQDGRFRVDDVSPGRYRLMLHLTYPVDGLNMPNAFRRDFATLEAEVTVPESDESDPTPLDLGSFELKPVAPLPLQSASR